MAVAGVVRAEEGGVAVGEAQMEEEARVEVRAVEARAAVRVVTGSEGGRGRQCHLPGWGCPALGPAADPSCRRGCRRGYRHFRSRARRSPRYRPRSRRLPCWPRRRRTSRGEACCRCVARGGVYASLSRVGLVSPLPGPADNPPSTNGAKGLLPLSLSGPRAKTKLTRKLISARTTSPYDSSEDNTPLSPALTTSKQTHNSNQFD